MDHNRHAAGCGLLCARRARVAGLAQRQQILRDTGIGKIAVDIGGAFLRELSGFAVSVYRGALDGDLESDRKSVV